MTSTPTANAPSAPSYASAAGAAKKSTSTPVVAPGSSQPVVATGSSAVPTPQHAKSSSISPLNGRPNIMPAVPSVPSATPAVAHGTSSVNGDSHARKPSVTITNGPNGGSAPKNIQFGFQDSPAASHSSPQPGTAPIPIPGSNPRVTSPQNSPSPIPQPSASGGRPPSGAPSGNAMTFGSFGGDGDRPHMRTASASHDPNSLGSHSSPHMRRSSSHSHNDMGNQPIPPQGGMGRGNFQSAGRGRGNFNSYNQPMGYPPGPNYPRGGAPNQGRGGMPPNFNPNNRQQPPYGTPPQAHRSPAMNPAMPHQQPPNVPPPNNMPNFYYPPPQMGPTQVPQNFYQGGYGYDPNLRPGMPMNAYPNYPMMHGQGSPAPAFQQPYGQGPYNPPGGQPMSRQGSQVSTHEHRPASSASQGPPATQGTPQTHHAQIKPAVVSSPQFTRPSKKSAAIVIKNPQGEALDLAHLKAPASPAPSSQQSKTPPIVSSTPPPPASAASKALGHSRNESTSTSKTAEEIKNEFKEKMKQAANADKAKEEEAAKAKEAEAAKAAAAAAAEKAAAEEKAKAEEAAKAAEAKAAEEEKAKAAAKEAEEAAAKAEAAKPAETEEEELERIIREMEEADAKREAEEEERRAKRKVEDEAKKKAEEEQRKSKAADNDKKLRDAEAEMERLEEEREAKRKQAGSVDVHQLLKSTHNPSNSATATSTEETVEKLANLSINDKTAAVANAKPSPGGRNKPAALNLAPLKTSSVEPPQPSAALQSLKTARLLDTIKADIYPAGIQSPNPALNAAVSRRGTSFKYDPQFLLQFKSVFTEQPSLDFNQQVKSLIGDGDGGRSASTRTPASGRQPSRGAAAFPMGNFGAPPGRTLPPGTTSEQRLAMSSGNLARPGMPISSFQRPGGAFPAGSSMNSRQPSGSNMGPHSPRQPSKTGGRNSSRQSTMNSKQEAQAAKTMPLTQGMKIESLVISQSGWKPTSVGKPVAAPTPTQGDLMDPPMVQRKVKAALNKMTPENFDRISEQILSIAAQSKEETDGRTLRQVIQLTFEKATDEAHWASMYAKFCKRMLETMSPEIRDESILDRSGQVVNGGNLFRKYLLNRCQEEFERGWKTNLPEAPEGDKKSMEAAMLSDEYYIAAALKRRGLGLVQFIGELYKLGMLTERIMHECVKKLVDYSGVPDEAEIESLSKLLRTIGGNLDATEKGRVMMDVYFGRIQSMMDHPELPSRLKFMLLDIVDLRKANWVSKEANKGPKTLDEIRAEAEAAAAQKAAEAARSSQRGGPGRPQMGRGDARNYSSGFPQSAPNQVGMDDLRRLKGGANRTSSSNMTLGPMGSMLNSRSNSGRRLGPPMSRGNEDSAASSRTGTPPVTQKSTNAFEALAGLETEHPTSPPSTAASPALTKAAPDTAASGEK